VRHVQLAAMAFCAFCLHAQAQSQGEIQVRSWAAACFNCHGTEGRSQAGMESLAGGDKEQMLRKVLDYKSGRKPATVMHQLSKGYSDEQLAAIVAYFAAQPK